MGLADYAAQDQANLAAETLPIAPLAQPAATAPPSKLQDPGFNDFLSKRAAQLSDLKAAQGKADEARRWADMGNGFARARDLILQRKTDEGALQKNLENADRPVQQAQQRQAAEGEATKNAAADAGLQKETLANQQTVDSLNPNSPLSKNARLLAVSQGLIPASFPGDYTASMHQDMLKGASIEQAREHAKAQLAQAGAQQAETARHNRSDESLRAQEIGVQNKRAEFEQGQKGRVPEQEAAKVVNQTQALKAIDQLEKLHGDIGLTGLSPIGNSAKNRYDDAVATLAGAVAAGALPAARETPALMEEFKKGFPGATTGTDRAKLAFQRLRETVKQNAAAQVAALKAGNYNPAQVAELERQIGAGGGGSATPATAAPVARVNLFDAKGQPVNLPAAQVDAYLAANPGAKRAGP